MAAEPGTIAPQAPVELGFWRTLYRYLLSIVASLACGAAWYFTGIKHLHLNLIVTIVSGVLALALGFIILGYLWLTLDLGRPVPEGVDADQRNTQLMVLWLGIPIAVLLICALVMVLALAVAATALNAPIPAPR
jgi:hypothetical protein